MKDILPLLEESGWFAQKMGKTGQYFPREYESNKRCLCCKKLSNKELLINSKRIKSLQKTKRRVKLRKPLKQSVLER